MVACVSADKIIMQKDWALGEVDEYAELAKEIQKFAVNGERIGKIQERGECNTAQKVKLPN